MTDMSGQTVQTQIGAVCQSDQGLHCLHFCLPSFGIITQLHPLLKRDNPEICENLRKFSGKNGPKFSDRQALANSAVPDQTALPGAV